jgi:hypothetical protein
MRTGWKGAVVFISADTNLQVMWEPKRRLVGKRPAVFTSADTNFQVMWEPK